MLLCFVIYVALLKFFIDKNTPTFSLNSWQHLIKMSRWQVALSKRLFHVLSEIDLSHYEFLFLSQGEATLQLSWTSKTIPWTLTLFFYAQYGIKGLYLYAPNLKKVPVGTCLVQKWLKSMDFAASHKCVLFVCNVCWKIYSEVLDHSYFLENQAHTSSNVHSNLY